ncbi:MAG: ferrous iron transporter B, partial [Firmicutes bacterium]|nr:ferrous iron transporter B [Bacillota bacterium]
AAIIENIPEQILKLCSARWLALRMLDNDTELITELISRAGKDLTEKLLSSAVSERQKLFEQGFDPESITDALVNASITSAEAIAKECVDISRKDMHCRERKLDKLICRPLTGIPIMLGLVLLIFWITVWGANYPSTLLSDALFSLLDIMKKGFNELGIPAFATGLLLDGAYRVLAWVVSVMLPPMAIFFPLFTLMEDFGLLPRIAFNLDKPFRCCGACGKQALTCMMGMGCNAAAVTGCRIIDSPRERLIAILTNCFMPCNGRFPRPFKWQFKGRKRSFYLSIFVFFVSSASEISCLWQIPKSFRFIRSICSFSSFLISFCSAPFSKWKTIS